MGGAILWDIDGTLVEAASDRRDLFHETAIELGGVDAREEKPSREGKTDRLISRQYLQWSSLPMDLEGAFLLALGVASESHYREYPRRLKAGAADALAMSTAHGYLNVLVTGNSRRRAFIKLKTSGANPSNFDWEKSAFGEVHLERNALGEDVKRLLPGRGLIVVGDTLHDSRLAAHISSPFVGVYSTSVHREELRTEPFSLLMSDFSYLKDFEKMLVGHHL